MLNSQITYLNHFVSIERSYNSNGEKKGAKNEMKNARGRPIPKETFGKIQDEITCTVGLIKDSNLTIGTFIRPGESSRC